MMRKRRRKWRKRKRRSGRGQRSLRRERVAQRSRTCQHSFGRRGMRLRRSKRYAAIKAKSRNSRIGLTAGWSILTFCLTTHAVLCPTHRSSSRKSNFKKPGKDGMNVFRAVMITGPPGIGKTTSAHLCAKLAGFTPIEVNASDSRSKKLVEVRLIWIFRKL